MTPFRIMFICTGNICRSPLAHALFENIVAREGLTERIVVESTGTDAYHVGERADPRMRQTSERRGVKINHRSKRLIRDHLSEWDLLLTMDGSNYRNTLALCGADREREKVQMFRDYDPDGSGDVPDPWYGSMEGFETVWTIVERTCEALLKEIRRKIAA